MGNSENTPSNSSLGGVRRQKLKRNKLLTSDAYIKGILEGNRTILSQAITLVESNLPKHNVLAQEIIEGCLPHAGNSIRIGITGVPGVGKSTFIEAIGQFVTENDRKLAVLAIDPSSQKSGGSILGDKTRMEELSANPKVYIRPSPAAGSLGGVARKTREAVVLLEAAGFNTIFIETVGVGQSEIAVHSMVDFFLLLMLAGAGDQLQGIKRGIMEMADAIIITKADGDNKNKAIAAQREYKSALHLFPPSKTGWIPRVEITSSLAKTGIEKTWEIIDEHYRFMLGKGHFEARRKDQASYWMFETIHEKLRADFYTNSAVNETLANTREAVRSGKISPFKAAQQLLENARQAHSNL